MAHFAEIDENGVVINVIVVNNEDCGNLEFPASEAVAQRFLQDVFGGDASRWKQTSYNSRFRKRYAGIGYAYMQEYDAFVEPKEYEYFVFDAVNLKWIPPEPKPDDGLFDYIWDDATRSWKKAQTSSMRVTAVE